MIYLDTIDSFINSMGPGLNDVGAILSKSLSIKLARRMDVTPEDPRYMARGALHLPSRPARDQSLLHLVVVGERRDRHQSSACIIEVTRLSLSAMVTPW